LTMDYTSCAYSRGVVHLREKSKSKTHSHIEERFMEYR
jgi:hypothetical protein